MKKVLIIILSAVMLASISLSAFAAGFVSSPSGNRAPRLISYSFKDTTCDCELDIEAYADRNDLSADAKTAIENAYNSIKNASDLTTLNTDLAALAKKEEIKSSNLAVSDLFDIYATKACTNSDGHANHGPITIKIAAETLDSFAGLLHYVNGAWELVSGAEAADGTLTFTVDSVSPFAIVVDTTPGSPSTNDNSSIYLIAAVVVVSAVAAVVCFKKSRKVSAN